MSIDHHPSPEHLAEYAAGTGTIGVDLIVACHATLCPTCRRAIEEMEHIGGAMAEREAAAGGGGDTPAHGSTTGGLDLDALIGKTLDAVTALPPEVAPRAPVSPDDGDAFLIFPAPLRTYLPDPANIPWRRVLPGAARFDLDIPGHEGPPIHLKKLQPGLKIPQHGHRGQEFDLVLAGGINDHTRSRVFDRGDLSYADTDTEHRLSILPGEVCITVSVAEAPVEASSWVARMLYKKAGW